MNKTEWKIMVISGTGVYFAGDNNLVENPEEAKWFSSYELAANWSKTIEAYNMSGVTQVRIISRAFENGL